MSAPWRRPRPSAGGWGGKPPHLTYYQGVALFSVLLGALLVAAIGLATARDVSPAPSPPAISAAAPRCDDGTDAVAIVEQAPNGRDVPLESAIVATFSCPVDRRAVERAFVIYPPVRGAFSWQGQTLTFRPDEPLRPRATYRVTLFGNLTDGRGFLDGRKVSWPFTTAPGAP